MVAELIDERLRGEREDSGVCLREGVAVTV
jgi:hypothetical protein